eukprot:m.120735 g.120735  ORF g.120735 m.120735 type:complete len:463 (-) comp52089_c0_seq9:960-2348(-)
MRPAPLPLVTLLHAALARTAPAHLPARRCLRTFARLPTTPAPSIIRRSLPLRSFHASAPLRKDLYEVLGVSKTAEQKDIKSAYYTLAKKYHPDANPGNKEAAKRFQEISEAYSVLSNESERARYDRNPSGMNEQGGFDANNFRDMSGFGSPEDLFAHLFGGRANSFGGGFGFNNMRSQHIETSVNLSFEESVQGCAKNVEYKGQIACEPCKGSGGKDGKPSKSKCTKCNGSGYEIGTMNGFLQYRTACSRCQGSGQSISNPCPSCSGRGSSAGTRKVMLDIPPGVSDGMQLQVTDGPSDQNLVIVHVKVRPSPVFKRQNDDAFTEVPVSLAQAVLGGSMTVKGLYGDLTLKIAAGTQPGAYARFSSKGFMNVSSGRRGDHIVKYNIKLPEKLSAEQKELMTRWAVTEQNRVGAVNEVPETSSSSTCSPAAATGGLFNKVRDLFGGNADKGSESEGQGKEKTK